jgi:hypothetical protein
MTAHNIVGDDGTMIVHPRTKEHAHRGNGYAWCWPCGAWEDIPSWWFETEVGLRRVIQAAYEGFGGRLIDIPAEIWLAITLAYTRFRQWRDFDTRLDFWRAFQEEQPLREKT